jgi:NAD(P)-dependent dehydrogenase (short-subunit alcohol dehydrogenase family)
VFFSNAGNDGPLMPIIEYPEDQFDQIIATHVRGHFLACKFTIPHMNGGGRIIITSSTVEVKRRVRQLLLRGRQTRANGTDAPHRQGGCLMPHPRQQRQSRTGRHFTRTTGRR